MMFINVFDEKLLLGKAVEAVGPGYEAANYIIVKVERSVLYLSGLKSLSLTVYDVTTGGWVLNVLDKSTEQGTRKREFNGRRGKKLIEKENKFLRDVFELSYPEWVTLDAIIQAANEARGWEWGTYEAETAINYITGKSDSWIEKKHIQGKDVYRGIR